MRQVLTAGEMRALEAECFRRGASPLEAMERAAGSVVEVLIKKLPPRALVSFACGPGNNGGDGYAAARLYAAQGGRAVVVPLGEEVRLTGDALVNCLRAHETPRVWFRSPDETFERPDAWVDALFGIGLTRPLNDAALRLTRRIAADRRAGSRVLAVDVPSGLDATTGRALGEAVAADWTVTFEYLKSGHVLSAGPEYCGEVTVAPIGLYGDVPNAAMLVETPDLKGALPPRSRESHKNTFGHLLLIAGSFGMAGAALIAARSALRSGVGLLTVACPASIVPILQVGAPAALCRPLPEQDGAISEAALPALAEELQGKTAVAIGPGLSRRAHAGIVRLALESGLSAAVDADALNLIAENPDLKALLKPHHVLTPHPGEAARLIGEKPVDLIAGARALRALGATAILKGPTSVICGSEVHLSISGTPGMARGGSGDALTGILGALLAQRLDPEKAAWVADELHGLAGEKAAEKFGVTSMGAMDLVESLSEVMPLAL
jgi:NAD(P)H-hydrate epimerase